MLRFGSWILTIAAVTGSALCATDEHRVVIVDAGVRRGVSNHRLLLLAIESGKVLADVEIGAPTNVATSDNGRIVAALTSIRDGEKRRERLDFYRTSDLALLQSGWLPETVALPGRSKLGVATNIHFSPDCNEIVFCGLGPPVGNVDFATTIITRVKRDWDEGRIYRTTVAAKIMPCRGVDFVSLAAWPKAIVVNQTVTDLLTIDLASGDIVYSLPVAEPETEGYLPLRFRGTAIADGGRYAFFIPRKAGELKKIDLAHDPPTVIATGTTDPDLRPRIAAVSEKAQSVFALEERPVPDERRGPAWPYAPSRWIKVFRASDLKHQRQMEVPLADCHWLAASRDGKYLYATGPERGPPFAALSIDQARVAVMDAATGRAVKVIDAGQHPAIVLPVAGE